MKFLFLCALILVGQGALDAALSSSAVRSALERTVANLGKNSGFQLKCSGGRCSTPSVDSAIKQFEGTIGKKLLEAKCRVGPSRPTLSIQGGRLSFLKPKSSLMVDYMVVIDGSGSVSTTDFNFAKENAKLYARELHSLFNGFSSRKARFAVIVFSNPEDIKVVLDFTTYHLPTVIRKIDSIRRPGRLTYTTKALQKAKWLFTTKFRPNAQKMLTIYTDGKSNGYYGVNANMPKPRVPAAQLKRMGVTIYGWPIGNVTPTSLEEIKSIVSSPWEKHILYASSYKRAKEIAAAGFRTIKNIANRC